MYHNQLLQHSRSRSVARVTKRAPERAREAMLQQIIRAARIHIFDPVKSMIWQPSLVLPKTHKNDFWPSQDCKSGPKCDENTIKLADTANFYFTATPQVGSGCIVSLENTLMASNMILNRRTHKLKKWLLYGFNLKMQNRPK